MTSTPVFWWVQGTTAENAASVCEVGFDPDKVMMQSEHLARAPSPDSRRL